MGRDGHVCVRVGETIKTGNLQVYESSGKQTPNLSKTGVYMGKIFCYRSYEDITKVKSVHKERTHTTWSYLNEKIRRTTND